MSKKIVSPRGLTLFACNLCFDSNVVDIEFNEKVEYNSSIV